MGDQIENSLHAALKAGKINGAVLCATDSGGSFVFNKAFGKRTLLSGETRPQQLDDVLFLASATKLISTIAALQCVDDGILALDDDLSFIAPELGAKQILTGFAEDGTTPLLEPATQPITLKMLLIHNSGLSYHFLNPIIAKWRELFAGSQTERRTVEELFSYPLAFQPGDGWMYGPGLDWAGRVVERVTRCTLGERMQQRIFDPLGITDGQFYPVKREDLRGRLVDLNPDDPDALGRAVLGGGGDMNKRTIGDFGGHGYFLPGADFMKVLHSLLANDGKLLKAATVDNMFQNHLNPQAMAGHQAALASPAGPFFRVGTDPGMKVGHGLGGLLTLENIDGWYGEHTLTWGGGLTFTWFIDRQNNICGLCAIQAALPVDVEVISSLKQTFRRDIYRKYAAWKNLQV
ncbi:beta-lactamase [Penicillium longicatenatum]|uniref:beta-lactamase n=1 Tax=Penicillium longicatenatum TaxID=1561947 RepID=UPI0025490F47|nr:beta-lactamase [Penicillium longicatenatum]KAJ5661350.1 beta-lactamase [Penicillium longicatenatum]